MSPVMSRTNTRVHSAWQPSRNNNNNNNNVLAQALISRAHLPNTNEASPSGHKKIGIFIANIGIVKKVFQTPMLMAELPWAAAMPDGFQSVLRSLNHQSSALVARPSNPLFLPFGMHPPANSNSNSGPIRTQPSTPVLELNPNQTA